MITIPEPPLVPKVTGLPPPQPPFPVLGVPVVALLPPEPPAAYVTGEPE
jgi:hypothetical protein